MRCASRRSLSAFSRSTVSSSSRALSTSSDPVPLRSSFWSGIAFSAPLRRALVLTQFGRISGQHAVVPPIGGRSAPTPKSDDSRVRQPKQAAPRAASALPIPETLGLTHDAGPQARTSPLPGFQRLRRTDEPWPNRPWLAVTPTRAPSTWRPVAVPRSCQTTRTPGRWPGPGWPRRSRTGRRDGLTGTRPPDGGVAVAEQLLGLALLAQADVLVPVELEGGGQVVDLGQATSSGPMPASS